MKTKLLGIFGIMFMAILVLSTISAATFVTQSTRFGADKSVSTLNLWADNDQGEAVFAYQKGVYRVSVQGKVTSSTESGMVVTGTLSNARVITNGVISYGTVTFVVNKATKLATINGLGTQYTVPLNVIK